MKRRTEQKTGSQVLTGVGRSTWIIFTRTLFCFHLLLHPVSERGSLYPFLMTLKEGALPPNKHRFDPGRGGHIFDGGENFRGSYCACSAHIKEPQVVKISRALHCGFSLVSLSFSLFPLCSWTLNRAPDMGCRNSILSLTEPQSIIRELEIFKQIKESADKRQGKLEFVVGRGLHYHTMMKVNVFLLLIMDVIGWGHCMHSSIV